MFKMSLGKWNTKNLQAFEHREAVYLIEYVGLFKDYKTISVVDTKMSRI